VFFVCAEGVEGWWAHRGSAGSRSPAGAWPSGLRGDRTRGLPRSPLRTPSDNCDRRARVGKSGGMGPGPEGGKIPTAEASGRGCEGTGEPDLSECSHMEDGGAAGKAPKEGEREATHHRRRRVGRRHPGPPSRRATHGGRGGLEIHPTGHRLRLEATAVTVNPGSAGSGPTGRSPPPSQLSSNPSLPNGGKAGRGRGWGRSVHSASGHQEPRHMWREHRWGFVGGRKIQTQWDRVGTWTGYTTTVVRDGGGMARRRIASRLERCLCAQRDGRGGDS